MDDTECQGNESSLAECEHDGWALHNCIHQEDVSISCNGTTIGTLFRSHLKKRM